jgi:glycine cleavage system H protein
VPEYLEYSLDKFIFRVAADRFYSETGVWAEEENGRVRIGLTDFLQQRSGDIAFVDVVEAGTAVDVGEELANIETIKVDISLTSPAGGIVVETNPKMEMEPEVINEDPYGDGWLAIIEASEWPDDRAKLLSPEAYYETMKGEASDGVRDQ